MRKRLLASVAGVVLAISPSIAQAQTVDEILDRRLRLQPKPTAPIVVTPAAPMTTEELIVAERGTPCKGMPYGNERNITCAKAAEFAKQLNARGLCWGPFNEIEAKKSWIPGRATTDERGFGACESASTNAAQAQCDKALGAHVQWSKEQCEDPSTALSLKKRMFARRHYGGELTDVEWDYLKRNPPADQRADIESLAKEEARVADCGPSAISRLQQASELCRMAQQEKPKRTAPIVVTPAAPNLPTVVTASEIESVRDKLRACWKSQGVGGAGAPIVTLVISMGRDGVPVKAEVRDDGRYGSDPAYRATADAVYRTIMNPRCSPWPLSPGRYEKWKTITFNFDPRDF